MAATVSESSTPDGGRQPKEPDRLETRDVTALMELMGALASHRNDSRRWRFELLTLLMRMLPASSAAAFIVKLDAAFNIERVASVFDAGFKNPAHHQAFHDEFNDAPFQDPLSKKCLELLFAGARTTLTAARRDLVADAPWYSSSNVERYRRPADIDDCLMSLQRSRPEDVGPVGEGGGTQVMVLCIFRSWDNTTLFSPRDRALLDTLHQGLAWMYRAEAMLERLTRATALTPRLRQTLDYLLAGDTERQVASKMRISIHTVHDYVKSLYLHFGVSSRGELMARWIQSGESLPAVRKDSE